MSDRRRVTNALLAVLIMVAGFATPFCAVGGVTLSPNSVAMTQQEIDAIDGRREGDLIFSGDLIFDARDLRAFGATTNLWTGGVMPYSFAAHISETQRSAFRSACADWEASGAVRCVARTSQRDYVLVAKHSGEKCAGPNTSCSHIGMQTGEQIMYIYRYHWNASGVLRHEIGHALGLIHEQSRVDREHYVIVQWGNIDTGSSNFRISNNAVPHTIYDYRSVMHYDGCAFAKDQVRCKSDDNFRTLVPRDCVLTGVGGSGQITSLDIESIRRAYLPNLMSMFESIPDPSCGIYEYSRAQASQACPGCVENLDWVRVEKHEQKFCNFAPKQDSEAQCKDLKKEYKEHHWNTAEHVDQCWGGTLIEYWVACGCTRVPVQGSCVVHTSRPHLEKVRILRQSSDPRERSAANLLYQLQMWDQRQLLRQGVQGAGTNMILQQYADPEFANSARKLLVKLRIRVALRRLVKPDYKLSSEEFIKLARWSGFSDPQYAYLPRPVRLTFVDRFVVRLLAFAI